MLRITITMVLMDHPYSKPLLLYIWSSVLYMDRRFLIILIRVHNHNMGLSEGFTACVVIVVNTCSKGSDSNL